MEDQAKEVKLKSLPLDSSCHLLPVENIFPQLLFMAITAIYEPMIYTAPCVMFLMHADPLRRQVAGGWALKIESFLGPVQWHQADRRVPFGAEKTQKSLCTGTYKSQVHRWFYVQELQRELPGPIAPIIGERKGLTASLELTVHGLFCQSY